MDWKGQFADEFRKGQRAFTYASDRERVLKFIETEIIEKLIEESHDIATKSFEINTEPTEPIVAITFHSAQFLEQLRAKWLGKN